MPLNIQCTGCGKTFRLSDKLAGKKVQCKACGGLLVVPSLSTAVSRPVAPAVVSVAAPAVSVAPAAPSTWRSRFLINFHRGFFSLGVALIVTGCVERHLASIASANLHTMTCRELERSGPGNNVHIHLTDFAFTHNYTYTENKDDPAKGWSICWDPLYFPDGSYFRRTPEAPPVARPGALRLAKPGVYTMGDPTDIRVILKSTHIRNEAEHAAFTRAKTTVDGMVVERIDALPYEEQRWLEETFPASNPKFIWIIEEGREPFSALKYISMIVGGIALILVRGYCMFRWPQPERPRKIRPPAF